MEGLEQQLPLLVGEEEEAETRAREEQEMREAEAREKLVQQLKPYKQCGGLLLKNVQESAEGKGTGKREALMLIVTLAGLENQEEETRFMKAQVEINRHERGGRKTHDMKIFLEDENALLKKVWRKLEKVCRQKGIRRYQIKNKSKVTPIKAKPPSELEKAKKKVKVFLQNEKLMKEIAEAERRRKEKLCVMVKECCQHLRAPKAPVPQMLAITYVEENSAPKVVPVLEEGGPEQEKEGDQNCNSHEEGSRGAWSPLLANFKTSSWGGAAVS